jgi:hypothetical protein
MAGISVSSGKKTQSLRQVLPEAHSVMQMKDAGFEFKTI